VFLDPCAEDFYADLDEAKNLLVAVLRAAAGRDPLDKQVTEPIGELSTRSTDFSTRRAKHHVRRGRGPRPRHPAHRPRRLRHPRTRPRDGLGALDDPGRPVGGLHAGVGAHDGPGSPRPRSTTLRRRQGLLAHDTFEPSPDLLALTRGQARGVPGIGEPGACGSRRRRAPAPARRGARPPRPRSSTAPRRRSSREMSRAGGRPCTAGWACPRSACRRREHRLHVPGGSRPTDGPAATLPPNSAEQPRKRGWGAGAPRYRSRAPGPLGADAARFAGVYAAPACAAPSLGQNLPHHHDGQFPWANAPERCVPWKTIGYL
jgi:transcription regulator MmyB-like protein